MSCVTPFACDSRILADLHALVWLENWLTLHFNGMVIIVSHDKFFLNNVCTDILELRSILAGQVSERASSGRLWW